MNEQDKQKILDDHNLRNSDLVVPSGYRLRMIPKWERVLRYPMTFCKHYRIMHNKNIGTIADRIHIAYLWANLSVNYKGT